MRAYKKSRVDTPRPIRFARCHLLRRVGGYTALYRKPFGATAIRHGRQGSVFGASRARPSSVCGRPGPMPWSRLVPRFLATVPEKVVDLLGGCVAASGD